MILAASCGQNAQKKEASSDAQFAELMEKIYYALPSSAMNEWLKTSEQRKAAKSEDMNAFPEYFHYINFHADCNYMRFGVDYGEAYSHDGWEMAGYLTDDQQNMVLIITADSGMDEVTGTLFDITLNYNVKTKKFTEIERPIEPFTTDELFSGIRFKDAAMQNQAKTFFENDPGVFYIFDKDGFFVEPNLNDFWYGEGGDVWEYYNETDYQTIYPPDCKVYCTWNGSRFEKGERVYR